MKKENWKAVINFIITVLTAITKRFLRQLLSEPLKGKKVKG